MMNEEKYEIYREIDALEFNIKTLSDNLTVLFNRLQKSVCNCDDKRLEEDHALSKCATGIGKLIQDNTINVFNMNENLKSIIHSLEI